MVLVGGRSEQERQESEFAKARFNMAMGPERSWSLHNLSKPCLQWGGKRKIRFVRSQDGDECTAGRSPLVSSKPYDGDSGGVPRKPPEAERKGRYGFVSEELGRSSSRLQPPVVAVKAEIGRRPAIGEDGIEAVRKKLMLDFQTEMDRMKFAVLSQGSEEIAPPPAKTEAPPTAEARPWNLRTRRAIDKAPSASGGGGGNCQRVAEGNSSFPSAMKSPPTRDNVGKFYHGGVKRPRTKLSIPLSKQEIEEDFIAMTGVRPPRKPKKRPRNIQKQLDTLFPGLGLSEITADKYKVNENLESRKR